MASPLLVLACSREIPVRPDDSECLQVTISDDEVATRSIVIDNPGIKLESFWKADDQIGVFGSTGQNIAFSVAGNTISKDGKTADFVSDNSIPSGQLMAYYPFSATAQKSGDGFTLDFPATQHYTMERGVVQPDPSVCMMAGMGSKGSGVSFVNLMAVLKVGQVFTEDVQVKSVEFRDLSGSPVSGPFTVSFTDKIPSANFSGSGKVIQLDLGSGIRADAGDLFIVFLVVPAREYPKGFEITFVAADGKKTVKTVGSRDGKTLHRSVVYPIGDINTYSNVPGMSYELKPASRIMSPDMLDMVKVTARDSSYVYADDGSLAMDADGNPVKMPYLTLLVHKDMNPQVDNYLIFNHPSTDMPQGGVYKVGQCKLASDGQHWEVYAVPEPNFAAPFEQLTIGGPLFNSDGNLNPDCGVDIDISSYIREIRDEEGNVISTQGLPSYRTNAVEVMTRGGGVGRVSFSTPDLTLSMDDQSHCTCDVSAKMSVSMRVAIGIIGGELQYIYTKVNPSLQLKTTFGVYGKYEYTKREHLWTFYTAGIPIGPIVLLPEVGFDIFGGVGGELKFSASTTFNYDLGTYGLMYNKGDGLTFKHEYKEPPADDGFNPSIPSLEAGLSGSLNAFAGIGMRAGISVYGMCSLGAATDAKLNFGLVAKKDIDTLSMGIKLALTPEIDITPYTAVLGGKLSKLWKGIGGKIEFKPLWERYLLPQLAGYAGVSLTYTAPISVKLADGWPVTTPVPNGTGPIEYKLTLRGKPINPMPVAIEVYESSDFNYIYYDPERFNNYMEAGVPHLYSSTVKMVNPKRVFSKIIGLHSEEETIIDFSNKEPGDWLYYPFQSGVAFNVRYNLYSGDGELLPRSESDEMYGQVYYWPFRANGLPY